MPGVRPRGEARAVTASNAKKVEVGTRIADRFVRGGVSRGSAESASGWVGQHHPGDALHPRIRFGRSPMGRHTNTSEVFDRVLGLLADPDARVRRATIARLPNFIDQRSRANAIFAEMIQSDDEALRAGVLVGLAGMENRPEWAVEAALHAMTDQSLEVRQAGAWLLEYTAADQLHPHMNRLKVLLSSSNIEVARVAGLKVDEINRAIETNP